MTAPNPLAFRFARMLADPAFRQRLHDVGWSNGMAVYPALPGETYAEVRARMEPGRHLLVAENPEQPFGLRMIVCEVDS
ncbi:hypothetical protein ACPPVO_22390 [Dactylosporangium sp. McL0621]|uniref:hypothetical protein n=1 Tax=Dactylosporangium sp. McL0621 TaxID=3415678 RepID=UPI003CF9E65C